jgi:hypothetical protein
MVSRYARATDNDGPSLNARVAAVQCATILYVVGYLGVSEGA